MRRADGPDGAILTVQLQVNPDAIRRDLAEVDVGIGELNGKPVTRDAALTAHATDTISGTITVTFDVDPAGQVWRRAKVTRLSIRSAGGRMETRTTTETLTRRLVAPARG